MVQLRTGGDVPFVGRADELATLLRYANDQEPVLLAGSAGSGKSRLVQEIAGLDEAPLLLVGRCSDQTSSAAYAPIRQIARQAARLVDPQGVEWSDLALESLSALFPQASVASQAESRPPIDEDTRRHTMWLAWVHYCDELAELTNRPIALVLEDAQWADQESLALFAWLAGQPLDVGLIVTSRPNIPDRISHLPTIPLGPLSVEAVADVLRHLGDSAEEASRVHLQTSGQPLHLRRWFTRRALAPDTRATSEEAGLAGLDDTTKLVMQAAALMQGEVDASFLASVLDVPEIKIAEHLAPAVTADLMFGDGHGRYWFSHDVYRDLAVAPLGSAERSSLHRRILAELEQRHHSDPSMLAVLAHHATKASIDGDRSAAIDYLIRAGTHARMSHAPESAHELLSLSLELAQMDGDPATTLRTRLELGLALVATSDTAAEAVLDQVFREAQQLNDAETFARAALAQPSSVGAVGVNFLGDPTAARRLREAAAMLDDGHPLLVNIFAQLALQQHATLTEADFFAYVERAEEIATASGDPELELTAFLARHGIRRPIGTLSTMRQELATRLDSALGTHTAFMPLTDLAVVAAMRTGDLGAVDKLLSRLEHELEPMHPVARWTLLRGRAALAHARGAVDQFEQLSLAAVTEAMGTRYEAAASTYFGFQVATAMRERQLTDEAEPAVEDWVHDYPSYLAFRAARAWLRSDKGDVAGCRSDLSFIFAQDLEEYVTRVEGLLLVAMATSAAWRLNEVEWCTRAHELLSPFRDEWIIIGGGTVIDGPTSRAMALASSVIGEHERAEQEIGDALAATVKAGAQLIEITCRRDQGYVLRAAARHGEAINAFSQAALGYESLGLTKFANLLEGQVAELATMHDSAPGEAVDSAESGPSEAQENHATIRHEGQAWMLQFDGESGAVADLKGMRMLHVLIRQPHEHLRAAALSHLIEHGTQAVATNGSAPAGGQQPLLDDQARLAYRERISQIGKELDRADRRGDVAGSQVLHAELDAITAQLEGARGLGGRSRSMADEDERARIRVRKSIRTAIDRIRSVVPSLGDHLDRSIKTGTNCVYEPDPRTEPSWTTS